MTTITEAWNHDYKDEKLKKGNYFYKFIKKEKGSTQELKKHNESTTLQENKNKK